MTKRYQVEEIIKEVEKETKEVFSSRTNYNVRELASTMFDFLKLPVSDSALNLEGLESRMMNAFEKILVQGIHNNDKETFFADFAKIEPFLRKLFYLLRPQEYASLKSSGKGLFTVIENLNLNPKQRNLETLDLKKFEGDIDFIDHLSRVYRFKNIESHEIKEWSNLEFGQYLQSFLVTYLQVTHKYRQELQRLINNTLTIPEPTYRNYLDSIIDQFKERVSRFIHLSSKEEITLSGSYVTEFKLNNIAKEEEAGRDGTVDALRQNNNIPERRMLLWGEAGLGKSTTLEYLAYRDANRRKKDSTQNIPVYIPLGLLTDPAISIQKYIFSKLEIGNVLGEKLLETGKLNLFIDGLNEIPKDQESNLITLRQKEIDTLIKTYKKTFIIITNRPQQVNQFSEVPVFFIQKMNDVQIKDFVRKYSEDKKAVEAKINDAIDKDDRLKRIIKTPLMLSRLIEIVKSEGDIPANEGEIIDKFIKSLYRREIIEKKDARFNERNIHKLLAYLAAYSIEEKGTNSALSENEVFLSFKKCKKEYGFDTDLDYALQIVVQLNLIERHNDHYIFAHQSYQDYFSTEYERIIMGI